MAELFLKRLSTQLMHSVLCHMVLTILLDITHSAQDFVEVKEMTNLPIHVCPISVHHRNTIATDPYHLHYCNKSDVLTQLIFVSYR